MGLLVDVAPPDFETRLAIIKNKAALLGLDLPDKVSVYIAQNVTSNVRQLEGTINKIMALKDLLGNDTDEETVSRAIQDMLRRNNEYVPTRRPFWTTSASTIMSSSPSSGPAENPGRRAGPPDRHLPHPQHDQPVSGRYRQGI